MKGARGFIVGLWLVPLVPFFCGGGNSVAFAQEEVPEVGLGTVHPICNTTSSATSDCVASDEEVQEEILAELEADDEVTDVRQDIELGELLCSSLDQAEDADLLSFEIFSNETVTAQVTSFTVVEADVFTDGYERKVWKGDVVDPPPAEDAVPRTISMTWATPCDVETFLLKMIDTNADGTTSVTTSVPCDAGTSTEICMVQFDIDLPNPSEPLVPAEDDEFYDTPDVTRHLLESRSTGRTPSRRRRRSPDVNDVLDMPGRRLQGTVQVDVMVLYSSDSLDRVLGGATTEQMESMIADEIPKANEATINSEVDLQFNLVHTGLLPYDQAATGSPASSSELSTLTYDPDVGVLRDNYGADLVVMVGSFSGTCGRGWVNTETVPDDERYGFSVIDARCFQGRTTTHEMSHNIGCLHDTANNGIDPVNDYSHGMRYCTGTGTRFHTIMAYYCQFNPPDGYDITDYVPMINHFSNPDVSYMGVPTGTATANNAQTLRDNMEIVSQFRVTCTDDSDCEGRGTCVSGICAVTECEGAGGNILIAGDGYCTPANNIAECGFDDGDCCLCDCEGDVCGSDGYDCQNTFSDCYEPNGGGNLTCDTTGIEGLVGTNDNGSVCCPTGCGQCGGAGCGSSGAGEGLGNTDCCINGVLNNQDFCSTSNQAPCIIDSTTTPEVEYCGDTTVEGLLGTNDNGSVCCPAGCGQCGGAGCGSSGAGEGLGNTDCCINGVLNNQEPCSTSNQAPCVIEDVTTVDTCDSLGIVAIEGSNANGAVCCPVKCLQCGGAGCASSGQVAGLDNTDCCINGVLGSQGFCTDSGEAPCVL